MARNKRMGIRAGRLLGLRSSDDLGECDSKGPVAADTRLYGSKRSAVINRRVAIRSIGCRCNMLRLGEAARRGPSGEATPSAASQSLAGFNESFHGKTGVVVV